MCICSFWEFHVKQLQTINFINSKLIWHAALVFLMFQVFLILILVVQLYAFNHLYKNSLRETKWNSTPRPTTHAATSNSLVANLKLSALLHLKTVKRIVLGLPSIKVCTLVTSVYRSVSLVQTLRCPKEIKKLVFLRNKWNVLCNMYLILVFQHFHPKAYQIPAYKKNSGTRQFSTYIRLLICILHWDFGMDQKRPENHHNRRIAENTEWEDSALFSWNQDFWSASGPSAATAEHWSATSDWFWHKSWGSWLLTTLFFSVFLLNARTVSLSIQSSQERALLKMWFIWT
jgi:hypothetical protein